MPAFVERYSAAMREALFHAAIDLELGVKGALRHAEAGTLAGLSAEDQATLASMAYGYATALVKDEREHRAHVVKVYDDTAAQAHELAARIAHLADREVRRAERKSAKTPVDAASILSAGKMMREALALTRDAAASARGTGKQAPEQPAVPPKPKTLAERIAARARTEQDDAHTNEDADGERSATHNNATEAAPNASDEGSVRQSVSLSAG